MRTKAEKAAWMRAYMRANPDQRAKARARWQRWITSDSPAAARERQRRVESARKWKKANPDKHREHKRRASAKAQRLYPERHRHHQALRRARLRASQSDVTTAKLRALWERSKQCVYCKVELPKLSLVEFDHVTPLARGGPHVMANLVVSCRPCNRRYGAN